MTEVRLAEKIIKFFKETKKTSWGKNEIVSEVLDIWIGHLKEVVDGNDQ